MSQQNIGTVRSAFDAYLRGDADGALAHFDPEVVFKRAEEAAVRGHDAVKDSWARWEADWEDLETIPEDFIAAGDRVLVPVLFRGRGRASGIEVEDRFHELVTLRDGKIVHWEEFGDRGRALEAAGLRE